MGTDLAVGTGGGQVPLLTAERVASRAGGPAQRPLVPDRIRSADRTARATYAHRASWEP